MIAKKIKEFEKLQLGLFVHFGLYSIVGKGEWFMFNQKVLTTEYAKLAVLTIRKKS